MLVLQLRASVLAVDSATTVDVDLEERERDRNSCQMTPQSPISLASCNSIVLYIRVVSC